MLLIRYTLGLLLMLTQTGATDTLKQVQIIFRHGSRSVINHTIRGMVPPEPRQPPKVANSPSNNPKNVKPLPNLPKVKTSRPRQPAQLTKAGYLQLYNLGIQTQSDCLARMPIDSFRKAVIKAHASSRQRCTDSAEGFLEGLQSIQDSASGTGDGARADEGEDGDVFINRHKIETEKNSTNYLFTASRTCKGIYDNTYKKGVGLSDVILRSLDRFLARLESEYGFYLEHYVKKPSPINYLRLLTINDYFNHIQVEHGVSFLSETDSVWLRALSSYVMIKWYTSDDAMFIKAINQELLSKISLYLDNRNMWDASRQKKSFDLVAYSAHDSSLLALFMGLGLNSLACIEKVILQAQSGTPLDASLQNSCAYSVEFADSLRIEMVEREGRLSVVLRRHGLYYKIANPKGWSSLTVCGNRCNRANMSRVT